MGRIIDEWHEFEHDVLSGDAGEVQRAEMRMAFISGCLASLALLSEARGRRRPHDFVGEYDKLTREAIKACEGEKDRLRGRIEGRG